mgnify:CR=1 FL=1|tara:strand:- start:125 stop:1237 length:1113 start_codon:yes stop_codon:yes gene_type:complete
MAIIFTKNYSSSDLLTTGNSWIVEFNSDTAEFPQRAKITFAGKDFYVDPKPDGSFSFDYKRIMNSLINLNNFEDSLNNIDIGDTSYVVNATNHFMSISSTYTIEFAVATNESSVKSYKFKKAVYDPLEFRLGNQDIDVIFDVLLPQVNGESYVRMKPEQPFDISIYLASNLPLSIANETNLSSEIVYPTQGVNRVFLQDGKGNYMSTLSLSDGWNRIRFTYSGDISNPKFVNVFQEPSSCKTVLKWFNLEGGFSTFPFIHEVETIGSKTKDFISNHYSTFDDYESNLTSTGTDLMKEREHTAVRVSSNEIVAFKGLIASPKVYKLHTDSLGLPVWEEISFRASDVRLTQTGKNAFDFQLKTFQSENGYTL